MQVSVPGIYQKPAPYSEQTLTYSTALALTGRSAACAPLMAISPAADPKKRLLIIFMSPRFECIDASDSDRYPWRLVHVPSPFFQHRQILKLEARLTEIHQCEDEM